MKTQLIYTLLLVCFIITGESAWADSIHSIEQGWSMADRQEAYTLDEGSEIMPLRWFLNLEQNGSNKKLIDKMPELGFIKDGLFTNPKNPYQLPVGMTVTEDQITAGLYGESKWVGVNCTACHTGLVEINKKKIIIDGGAGLFNIQDFEKNIIAAVDGTLSDSKKFNRFAKKLGTTKEGLPTLSKNLSLFRQEFSGWVDRNHRFFSVDQKTEIPYGPGRVDGLGGATNDLICRFTDRMGDEDFKKLMTDPRNCVSSQPAVSLPHLWGIADNEWVQWDGGVHLSLARNYGQATATYGKNWIQRSPVGGFPIYRSTAKMGALNRLEDLYRKLETPNWDKLAQQGLVPPINAQKAQNGKAVYEQNCLGCHAVQPALTEANAFGNSYWSVPIYKADELGVDDLYLRQNQDRIAYIPPALAEGFKTRGPIGPNGEVSAAQFRAFIIGVQLVTAGSKVDEYIANGLKSPQDPQPPFKLPSILELPELLVCRNPLKHQTVVGLKARSLEGVIFTAPYLHNGSVPSLAALLEPAAQRPKQFYVGCREYNIDQLGYDCKKSDQTFLFNTALDGNSNQGHEYGVNLSSNDKLDLIEYLKSLKNPERPPRKSNCY